MHSFFSGNKCATLLLLAAFAMGCKEKQPSKADAQQSLPTSSADSIVPTKDTTPTVKWTKPVYDSTKKYIYLTFDDGPQGQGTQNCIDLCKKNDIKATFFMIGQNGKDTWGKSKVEEIKAMYPQFLLANHSYTHTRERYKYFYSHPQMALQDFLQAQNEMQVPYKIIRLPGNSAWVRDGELKSTPMVRQVCNLLDSAGYNVMGWDVEWNFSHKNSDPVQSPEKLAGEVNYALSNRTNQKNHVVILTHDRMFRQPHFADSLNKFINLLKQNPNYVFETMENYPNMRM